MTDQDDLLDRISSAYREFESVDIDSIPVRGNTLSFEELLERKLAEASSSANTAPSAAAASAPVAQGSRVKKIDPFAASDDSPLKSSQHGKKPSPIISRNKRTNDEHRRLLSAYGNGALSDSIAEDEPVMAEIQHHHGEPMHDDDDLILEDDNDDMVENHRPYYSSVAPSSSHLPSNSFADVDDDMILEDDVDYPSHDHDNNYEDDVEEQEEHPYHGSMQAAFSPPPSKSYAAAHSAHGHANGSGVSSGSQVASSSSGSSAAPQSKLVNAYFGGHNQKQPSKVDRRPSAPPTPSADQKRSAPAPPVPSAKVDEVDVEQEALLKQEIEKLRRARESYESKMSKLDLDRKEMQRKADEEHLRFTKWCEVETEKIKKERAALDREKRSSTVAAQQASKTAAAELEELKQKHEMLNKDAKERDNKSKMTIERLQRQVSFQKDKIAQLESTMQEKDKEWSSKEAEWLKKEKEWKDKWRRIAQRPLMQTLERQMKEEEEEEHQQQQQLQLQLQQKQHVKPGSKDAPKVSKDRPASAVFGLPPSVSASSASAGPKSRSSSATPQANAKKVNQQAVGTTSTTAAAVRIDPADVIEEYGQIVATEQTSSKTVYRYDSGVEVIKYAVGTTVHKHPPPSSHVATYFFNGDVKTKYSDRVEYYFAKTRTTNVSYPDGVQMYYFENGQIEKHFPDGEKEITFPDGTVHYLNAAGEEIEIVDEYGDPVQVNGQDVHVEEYDGYDYNHYGDEDDPEDGY